MLPMKFLKLLLLVTMTTIQSASVCLPIILKSNQKHPISNASCEILKTAFADNNDNHSISKCFFAN